MWRHGAVGKIRLQGLCVPGHRWLYSRAHVILQPEEMLCAALPSTPAEPPLRDKLPTLYGALLLWRVANGSAAQALLNGRGPADVVPPAAAPKPQAVSCHVIALTYVAAFTCPQLYGDRTVDAYTLVVCLWGSEFNPCALDWLIRYIARSSACIYHHVAQPQVDFAISRPAVSPTVGSGVSCHWRQRALQKQLGGPVAVPYTAAGNAGLTADVLQAPPSW